MEKIYRQGVLGIIIDDENNFLIVQLNSYGKNEWNFVGGGKDGDETAEENVIREIKEELGIKESDFHIIGKTINPFKYDFLEPIMREGVLYSGQIKEQFLVKFTGDKSSIKLQKEEVRKHKWVKFEELEHLLIFRGQFDNVKKVLKELNFRMN